MEHNTEVFYYWAPWCSSCKTVGPMLEKLCAARGATLHKINADVHPLDPRVANYTALPIVLIVGADYEVAYGGAAVTARTLSDSIV